MGKHFRQHQQAINNAVYGAEQAQQAYSADHVAAMGQGLADALNFAHTRLGEAIVAYLDDGHYMHLVNLREPNQPYTEKGDVARMAYGNTHEEMESKPPSDIVLSDYDNGITDSEDEPDDPILF